MTARNTPIIDGHGLVLPPANNQSFLLTSPYGRFLARCHDLFLSLEHLFPTELRPAHAQLSQAIHRAIASKPRVMLQCYASPTIATPLQCSGLMDALPQFSSRIRRQIALTLVHLAIEMATRDLLGNTSIEVPASLGPIASLRLGVSFRAPAHATRVIVSSKGLEAWDADARVGLVDFRNPEATTGFETFTTYHRVGRVSRLALTDHNPIAAFEAHPDKHGNHVDLGDHSASEWAKSLEEAFALVEQFTPDIFHEMSGLFHEVVPVGFDLEKHLSASYREAIGTVYLTLHPQVMTMAEALVHEFQHNKLNLASYFEDFLENAFEPLYKSPVRPDPRPLWGILLAVHAFLPVAVLYRRMRDGGHPLGQRPDFLARLETIDRRNHEGMEMLRANGRFTPAGKALMAELESIETQHLQERSARGVDTQTVEAHVA